MPATRARVRATQGGAREGVSLTFGLHAGAAGSRLLIFMFHQQEAKVSEGMTSPGSQDTRWSPDRTSPERVASGAGRSSQAESGDGEDAP